MWAHEATFYQIYPLGLCGAPRVNEAPAGSAPVGAAAADESGASEGAAPVGCGLEDPCSGSADLSAISDAAAGEAAGSAGSNASGPEAPIMRIARWAGYLQELGIGAVLVNPPFESDSHGYDTRDLAFIDQRLGTNADFAAVCAELHARGIRVVLDAVFNHVGRGFWAFRDVQERRWDSPYKDWFNISFDGDSNYGDGFWYEGWEGHYELVKLNLRNPAVVDHLLGVVRGWVEEFGIDGLRLDVAYLLDRDFICRLHDFTRSLKDDFVLIGETLHGDYNQIVNDRMLDSCTNYECYKGLYSSFNSQNMFEIGHSLHRQFGSDPWCIYQGKHLLSFADNHDVPRLASILSDKNCLRPAYGVLFGMPGIPCVYYGSEWGLEGEKGGPDGDWTLRPAIEKPAPNELTVFISQLAHLRAGQGTDGAAGANCSAQSDVGVEPDARAAERAGLASSEGSAGATECAGLASSGESAGAAELGDFGSDAPVSAHGPYLPAGAARKAALALGEGGYRNVVIQNKQLLFERACGDACVYVAVNAVAEGFTLNAAELNGSFIDLLAPGTPTIELSGALDLALYDVRYLLRA